MLDVAEAQFSTAGVKWQLASCHRHVQIPCISLFQVLYCLNELLSHFALLISWVFNVQAVLAELGTIAKLVLPRAGSESRVGHGINLDFQM